ncbi:MAG: hypothetical protein WCO93_00275 [bacterium]
MKIVKTCLVLFVLLMALMSEQLSGQNILMLEKIGTLKKYNYQVGDFINILTTSQHLRLKNYLWSIEDSSIMIGTNYTVRLNDIKSVRRDVYFPKLLSKITLIAGAGLIAIDVVNNLINGLPVFNESTLIIGGCLIGAGLVLIPLSHKNLKIGYQWKLKILTPL